MHNVAFKRKKMQYNEERNFTERISSMINPPARERAAKVTRRRRTQYRAMTTPGRNWGLTREESAPAEYRCCEQ